MNRTFNPTTFGNQKQPSSVKEFSSMLAQKLSYMCTLRINSKDITTSDEYSVYDGYHKEILKWIDFIMVTTPFSGFDYNHKHQIKNVLKGMVSHITKLPYNKLAAFVK